jgi:hydrogenase/urease accessory protein HupE
MDLQQFALAGFVLIGLVNGIQFAVKKEWSSFIFFMTAVVAGSIFGYLQWFQLPSLEIGLAVGLASSGVYKTGQLIGGTK